MMGSMLLLMALLPFSNGQSSPDEVARAMVQRLDLNIRYLERAQLDPAPDPVALERHYSEWLRHQSLVAPLGGAEMAPPQGSFGLSVGGSSTVGTTGGGSGSTVGSGSGPGSGSGSGSGAGSGS